MEELHDLKRVHRQGEEEDLRIALGRTISRVEELVSRMIQTGSFDNLLEHSLIKRFAEHAAERGIPVPK